MILSPTMLSNATAIAREVIQHGELNYKTVTNAFLGLQNAQFRMQWLACNRQLDVTPWRKEDPDTYAPLEKYYTDVANSRIGSALYALQNHFYFLDFKEVDDLISPSFELDTIVTS